jgi:nucleolar protein 56
MNATSPREAVSTWFGAFVVDHGAIVRAYLAPTDPNAIRERIALRRAGDLTPEELQLVAEAAGSDVGTRDRRLAERGLRLDLRLRGSVDPATLGVDVGLLWAPMMEEADRALHSNWDPSIHVQEAVRAMTDLDHVRNLLGERLGSWTSRDAPEADPGDHAAAARLLLEGVAPTSGFSPPDPTLARARRRLAETYRAVESVRSDLEKAVEETVPKQCPNLSALLGPALAARMLAQAGGLDRMSRLPASTIQVLGAERAFFEHLRGRASPPRHGLLFLHPRIQSAGRAERGRLSRALAGKTAIAARLDRYGSPLDPELSREFESRAAAIRASPRKRVGGRSRPPFHRAPQHR